LTAAQTQSTAPLATAEFVQAYGAAWNAHDVAAIMSMHTEDTTFCQRTGGSTLARGQDAVRDAFAATLELMPDMHFETRRLLIDDRGGFFVHEMTYTATVPAALATRNGADGPGSVSVDLVDVITLRDGLVASKDTYVDTLAIQRQLGSLTPDAA